MIVCCGEALIDMIPTVDHLGEQSLKPHAGGAIFNTAIALGRLGVLTHFVSGISTDLFGKILLNELHKSNVNTEFVLRSHRPSTLAFVELENGHASYVFYDENTAGRMLSSYDLPTLPDAAKAMYFGGISLINEPAADFYLALAMRESARRIIVLDPNIRSNFIEDEQSYRARLDKFIAHADILKVSDEDLNWIISGPLSEAEKVHILRERGPAVVVLTRGSAGACAFFGDKQIVEIAAENVDVEDTVGAGDTFNAGFLAKLAEDAVLERESLTALGPDALKRALAHGAKVAAITVSRAGANPPWAHELA